MKNILNLRTGVIIIIQLITLTHLAKGHYHQTPTPSPWPLQFHALMYTNLSSTRLQISNLWYDWPRGRNVYISQKQLGVLLYNIEWNNGTTFYFTLGDNATCRTVDFGVGIPRPDFLDGAEYLGTRVTDGFLCNVWEKVDFIWYYEDVLTKRPVRWDFSDGMMEDGLFFTSLLEKAISKRILLKSVLESWIMNLRPKEFCVSL